jgi:hypothetical protein
MGGSSDDGYFGPSIEEQREDIASLLANFDPASSERYTGVERPVHYRGLFLKRGKPTDTYPVGWTHNIYVRNEGNDPLAIRLHAELKPSVWVTSDLRFLQEDPLIFDWLVTTIEKIPVSRYKSIQLGLRGDFESIDREFEAACQTYAADAVDKAIREMNTHRNSSLAAILLPSAIDTSTSDFAWRRQQCIEALLREKNPSV